VVTINVLLTKSKRKMINNPEWEKSGISPYIHQFSLYCIEKLAECMEDIDIKEMDCGIFFETQKQILIDEIEDQELLEFVIENLDELLSYIATGNLNIRIQGDITGEMWFGVSKN
jgi:hypothetical protein